MSNKTHYFWSGFGSVLNMLPKRQETRFLTPLKSSEALEKSYQKAHDAIFEACIKILDETWDERKKALETLTNEQRESLARAYIKLENHTHGPNSLDTHLAGDKFAIHNRRLDNVPSKLCTAIRLEQGCKSRLDQARRDFDPIRGITKRSEHTPSSERSTS